MRDNPRQSCIVDSKPGIPDSTYWIPVFVSGTWIPDSYRFGIRISWVVSGFLSLGFRFRIPRVTISQFPESKFPFTRMTLLIIKGAEKGISVWACMFWYWQTSCFQFWSDDFWGQPLHQPFQPQFTMKGKFDFLFVQCQARIAEKLCRRGFMWAVTSKEFIHRLKS